MAPAPIIALVNESTLVTAAEAKLIAQAVNLQQREHFAPAWSFTPWPVRYYASEHTVPDHAILGVILDDADQAGVMGYHDETPEGRPYFRNFARPSFAAGSKALSGPYALSATVSHEVGEARADLSCQVWVDDGTGREVAQETGDPVEADGYPVALKGGAVTVSNFAYPGWFDYQASHGVQFDHLHRVSRPFQMTAGGYLIVRQGGAATQVFGDEVPEWKRHAGDFPASRTAHRLDQRPTRFRVAS